MTVKVMVLKNKEKEGRYLAAGIEFGDWADPDLDVAEDNLKNALMTWTSPGQPDLKKNFEGTVLEMREHKRYMIERYGDNAFISLDIDEVLKKYEPVEREISEDDLYYVKSI